MSSFVLKIIACITMFIDHIGYVIFGKTSSFNYIGRLAFPIFAFQVSQGYTYTKNYKKYLWRLLLFALISQVPYMLFCSMFSNSIKFNVIFTLLLGLVGIISYDKLKNKLLSIMICILLGFIAHFTKMDYGFYGVAIIVLFYIFRNKKLYMSLSFIISTLLMYVFEIFKNGYNYKYIVFCLLTILSLAIILLYNEKKGKDTKYLLYLFYPIQFIIVYIIYLLKYNIIT